MAEIHYRFPSHFVYETEHFIVSGKTVPRKPHALNFTTIAYIPGQRLAMLFDGSSGSGRGRKASRRAARFLSARFANLSEDPNEVEEEFRAGLKEASADLLAHVPGAATTAVVAKFIPGNYKHRVVFGNVGDSRGYHLDVSRKSQPLTVVTTDHNILNATQLSDFEKRGITARIDELEDNEELHRLDRDFSPIVYFFRNSSWVVQLLGGREIYIPSNSPYVLKRPEELTPSVGTVELDSGDFVVAADDGVYRAAMRSGMRHTVLTSRRRNLAASLVMLAEKTARNSVSLRSEIDDRGAFVFAVKPYISFGE